MSRFWVQTHTGRRFDLLDVEDNEIEIYDIAHALGNLCRFNGHTAGFYSVAEHSVVVSLRVPPEDQLQALLHDATEAYLGDVTEPLKRLLPEYRTLESRLWAHIARTYGVRPELTANVRQADKDMLQLEAWCLMPNPPEPWDLPPRAPDLNSPLDRVCHPRCLGPKAATGAFLDRYCELTGHAR